MQSSKPLIPWGWLRAVAFIVIYIGIITLAGYVFNKFFTKESFGKFQELGGIRIGLWVTVLIGLVCTFLSVWICRRFIDHESVASLGFAWKGNSKHVLTGFFAAIAMLGMATLILIGAGYLHFTQWTILPGSIISSIVFMLMIAVYEELTFRGYLLYNLMQSTNKWVALLITAVLFCFIHTGNPGAGVLPMIEIFIAGLMLGINYIYTRNLWFGIFLHFTWNFFEGPVFGYKVSGIELSSIMRQDLSGPAWLSGGVFGIEGSLLAIVLNLMLIGLLVMIYNRKDLTITNNLLR